MILHSIRTKAAPFTLWLTALALRKCLHLSSLIAPHFIVVTPLLGSFLSASSVCASFAAFSLVRFLIQGLPITLGLPTLFATLSWSVSISDNNRVLDALLHLLLPVVCMVAFITHPIGNQAPLYACYWFIPMIAWALRTATQQSHILMIALQSTFLAHAVGSVMWLFAVPTTMEYWLMLIPVVAVERLTMAASSALLYAIGCSLGKMFSRHKNLRVAAE